MARASFCLLRIGNVIAGTMTSATPMTSTSRPTEPAWLALAATVLRRSGAFKKRAPRTMLRTPAPVPMMKRTPTILPVVLLFVFTIDLPFRQRS
jgi:hypothetical protein